MLTLLRSPNLRLLLLACLLAAGPARAADASPQSRAPHSRVKDLCLLDGVRDNQLVGYGLVIGLAGTGDRRQTVVHQQTLANMLQRMGVAVSPEQISVNNIASVMLTATLPPYAQPGAKLDVTVASLGDAASLRGGILLMTSLRGPDGQTYAVAQGPVVTGGFTAARAASSQTVNHPTVGRIPGGALVERPSPTAPPGPVLRFLLHHADFATATRIADALNKRFAPGDPIAHADHAGQVTVRIPIDFARRRTEFVAAAESLEIQADRAERVVVNERTGTIVMGRNVRIAPVMIMHGNLTIEIETQFQVSQPAPLSNGQTAVTPDVRIGSKEDRAQNVSLDDGATVEDLVRALSKIGSTPRDIIAILQNLKAAGALDAEIEVI